LQESCRARAPTSYTALLGQAFCLQCFLHGRALSGYRHGSAEENDDDERPEEEDEER
jgi:hypothetical protein